MKKNKRLTVRELEQLETVYDERFDHASYPYPFGGYGEVLDEALQRSAGKPGVVLSVLDLRVRTGDLSARFVVAGHDVTALRYPGDADPSARLPEARVVELAWDELEPATLDHQTFDRLIIGYGLSEQDRASFLARIPALCGMFLGRKGALVIAGTLFEDDAQRASFKEAHAGRDMGTALGLTRAELEEIARRERLKFSFAKVSPCGGVCKLTIR